VPTVILAAGLLVLLGLGLFVGGVLTGATALYWGCVAACVVAAGLLLVARRRAEREAAEEGRSPTPPSG
jgi:enoyl-CoA hydratase/carnithine racemase